ncbi:MAG: cyclic nucleotide-binding/CBS domain-containing protein [Nitrospinota bacterium]
MIKVKDRVSRSLHTLSTGTSALDTARFFLEHKIGSVFIRQDDDIVGIITESDLVRKVMALNKPSADVIVDSVMTKSLISVDIEESLTKAGDTMDHNHIRHLGVTEGGKIVGVISVRDLIHPIYTDGEGW